MIDYNKITISKNKVMEVNMLFRKDTSKLELPIYVGLQVSETEPWFKGYTNHAILETVSIILVNTEQGIYVWVY
jgi:hypothetical protein